ncbi:MAG TPA: alpha/beta fold hydrolase, partial [Pedobacter sp.]|nr:alpha/beta fold hydrolase [Pedobacter sp.]
KKTDSIMSEHGVKISRASLTGQGERVHLSSPEIDLNTHIKDVVNLILYENLHNVILVGHSYGGMVITGVADSIPGRIKKLVFLDAILPNDGESLATSKGTDKSGPENSPKNGFIIPEWVKPNAPAPKDVPQSVKTFTQPVSFNNPMALKIPATYILTVDPGKMPESDGFYAYGERAKKRGYKYLIMSADHNPQFNKSEELATLLEKE